MARGKQTHPLKAAIVIALAELDFQATLIGELTGIPQRTAAEIVGRKGVWKDYNTDSNEVLDVARRRIRKALEANALGLAAEVLKRLEDKIPTANYWEALGILEALSKFGGLRDD